MSRPGVSVSSTSRSAPTRWATRAARRSLSPKRISSSATASFSLTTGTTPRSSSRLQRRPGRAGTAGGARSRAGRAAPGRRPARGRRGRRRRPASAGSGRRPTRPAGWPMSAGARPGAARARAGRRRWRPSHDHHAVARPREAGHLGAQLGDRAARRCRRASSVIDDVPILTTTITLSSSVLVLERRSRRCGPCRPAGRRPGPGPGRRRGAAAGRGRSARASTLVRSLTATARSAWRPDDHEAAVVVPLDAEALGAGPVHDEGRRARARSARASADQLGQRARPARGRPRR